ncbi:gamma-glutamylcyclotransferase [Falsibacillus pallidus]|uniref:gamma-glutamylcyclotransferase n=1 Tax=Falsibacillus pallidus TaxID=493781 RepID=UPI003D97E5E4
MSKKLLFVYGTLRRHEKNHSILAKERLAASQAWINGTMFDTGSGYPTVELQGSSMVYGELYEINEAILPALDELEGYRDGEEGSLFNRTICKVHTDIGEYEAHVYTSGNKKMNKDLIEGGDWRVHQFFRDKLKQELYYFAYGSCMDDERFAKASVDHLFKEVVGRGTLENFSMKYTFLVHDGGRGDIVEDGGSVEGVLYKVDWRAFDYLFEREGVAPGWYRPALVDVTTADNAIIHDVVTFIVIKKDKETCPPLHYAREIMRGAKPYVSSQYLKNLYNQVESLQMNQNELSELKRILE